MERVERLKLNNKEPLYVLKIGGSVITEKDKELLKIRREVVRRVAIEIKTALSYRKFKLVFVHGVGPYGHKLVYKYGIKDGLRTEADFKAFLKVQRSVSNLNKKIVSLFKESSGLELIPIPPHEIIIQKNKKIVQFDLEPIKENLAINKIPVLYGDMVIDIEIGGSVVSGDAIVSYLGAVLDPELILLGTDVDGIFDSDPKINRHASLIPIISKANFQEILDKIGGAISTDVTMGMRGKILALKEICYGKKAIIFSALTHGNLEKVLKGESIPCTFVDMS